MGAPWAGSVYIFEWDGSSWTEQAKLTTSIDGFFGYSAAICGNMAVVGSWSEAAYVFSREGEMWTEESELLASDGETGDKFGWSVATDGNIAVVGTYWAGAAYVFNLECNESPVADANGSYLGAAGSAINFDGSCSYDPDGDELTYDWDWGDGSSSSNAGANPSHSYSDVGIYDVCLTVSDGDLSDTACTYVVVYDPNAGFVTGGGWIDSPVGAYIDDPLLMGKATFGFVSRYKKGADTPSGQTEFQFKAGNLNFHSTEYQWLVVNQGGTNAQFKGTGTINGTGEYKFMLWAGDGAPDTFRIKIWTEDGDDTETVRYDNGYDGSGYENGQPISGGSIIVHKGKK